MDKRLSSKDCGPCRCTGAEKLASIRIRNAGDECRVAYKNGAQILSQGPLGILKEIE